MLAPLTLLLACQLVGEVVARSLSLPVPGPVLGLALLAAGLWWNTRRLDAPPEAVEETPLGGLATGLLANLGLLFVPAGVGVIEQLPVLGEHGLAIVAALVVSTVVTLVVTVVVFRLTRRLAGGGRA